MRFQPAEHLGCGCFIDSLGNLAAPCQMHAPVGVVGVCRSCESLKTTIQAQRERLDEYRHGIEQLQREVAQLTESEHDARAMLSRIAVLAGKQRGEAVDEAVERTLASSPM